MGRTKNFFEKKKPWSIIKDQLLAKFLPPYLEKVKLFNNDIIVIDCFAGKGIFDDGSDGSPLIILNKINQSGAYNKAKALFVEEKYANDLRKNITPFSDKCEIVESSYQDTISRISQICYSKNVFLYIDPYGIKPLDFHYFEEFNKCGCKTIEMLLNFNTFGFIREACRLLGENDMCNDDENDIDYEEDGTNNIVNMNKVANGDYWRKIISRLKQKEINSKTAEFEFSFEYETRLKQIFKYVINVPISDKTMNMPKYRMYYGGNSPDGLMLMVDRMNEAWKTILKKNKNEEIGELFAETSEYSLSSVLKVFHPVDIKKELLSILTTKDKIDMKDFFIAIIKKSGITYSIKDYRDEIRRLENNSNPEIIIERTNKFTKTGKISRELNFEKQVIYLKKA